MADEEVATVLVRLTAGVAVEEEMAVEEEVAVEEEMAVEEAPEQMVAVAETWCSKMGMAMGTVAVLVQEQTFSMK